MSTEAHIPEPESAAPLESGPRLADLLDLPALQALMDDFHALTGFGMALADLDGAVLVATGEQEICAKFHHVHPETRTRCMELNPALAAEAGPDRLKLYRCPLHLWDLATPILAGDRRLGHLFLGPFFFDDETPDLEAFRAQARRHGFDESDYLAALDRVPRWGREQIGRAMAFFAKFAGLLSELGFRNRELARSLAEQRRAQERLRLHAQLLEAVRESVVATDLDGRILYWGRGAEKLYGHSAAEVLGRPYRNFAGAIDPPDEEAFRRLLLDQGSWHGEHVQRRKTGETFWTSTFISVVLDENGQPVGYVGIDQDITRRKQAEQTLRESEERFRQVAESAEEWIWELDAAGVYTYSSPVVEPILGYRPEELVGRMNFIDLIAPEAREAVRAAAAGRAARREGFQRIANPVLRKDGRVVILETTGVPILDPAGRLAGYRGADTDITARTRAEAALRHSEAQLSNALEMAHAGHWEYDVATDRFTFNDNFYRIFRTTAAEVGGYQMSSPEYARRFCHPDDLPLVAEEVRKAIETTDPGYNRQIEHRILYADGSVGHIAVRFFIAKDAQGRTFKTFGVNQDITAHKRIEEELRAGEMRHRTFIEAATDLVFLKDDAFRYLISNRANNAFLGKSGDEVLGHTDFDLMRPETAARCRESDEDALRQGTSVTREETAGNRTYLTVKFPVPLPDGRTGVGGYVRDITDQKRTEEQLQAFAARYRDIATNIPGAIYQLQINRNGTFEVPYMSAGAEALFERPLADRSFTSLWFDHMHVGDFALLQQSLAAAARELAPWGLEFRILRPDGRPKWVRGSANPRRLPDGRVLWTGVLLDIDDLRQAEASRRDSEERFRLLVRNSSDILVIIAANGTLRYISPAEEAITGYAPEELAGKSIRDVIHPDDLERTLLAFQTALAQPEKTHRVQCRHRHKTRGWVQVEIVGQSFLEEPAVRGVIVNVRDVTERRAAEDRMALQLEELRRWWRSR